MSRVPRVIRAISDVAGPITSRPTRTAAGAMGAFLGAVAVILAASFGAQSESSLARDLSVLDSSRITVSSSRSDDALAVFPTSTLEQVAQLPGVRAVGLSVLLGTSRVESGDGRDGGIVPVFALSSGAMAAAGIRIRPSLSRIQSRRDVLVGSGVTRTLKLPSAATLPSIGLRRAQYSVAGVITEAPGLPSTLGGVVVKICCGRTQGAGTRADMLVATEPGLTVDIADRLARIVDPTEPSRVTVSAEPTPTELRSGVEASARRTSAMVAVAALVLGIVVNGLLRYIAVRERRAEFGLRMALGADTRDVVMQVTGESVVVSLVGICVGLGAGLASSTVVIGAQATFTGTTPALCGTLILAGISSGVVAGLFPAVAAVRISPARALRT